METQKLFSVLVIGGALLAGGSIGAQDGTSALLTSEVLEATEGEPVQCFCNLEKCCDVDCEGKKKVKDGFVCCWNTSCDEN